MQEDRRRVRRLPRLVARDRIEVGADHGRVGVHLADAGQPFVVGTRATGSLDEVLIARGVARRAPAVLGADAPIRTERSRIGRVAEEAERLSVPCRDDAEREHPGRCRAVARTPLEQRTRAVPAEAGRLRTPLTTPRSPGIADRHLDGAGRRRRSRRSPSPRTVGRLDDARRVHRSWSGRRSHRV